VGGRNAAARRFGAQIAAARIILMAI